MSGSAPASRRPDSGADDGDAEAGARPSTPGSTKGEKHGVEVGGFTVDPPFSTLFAKRASSLRGRLALRYLAGGVVLGLVAGVGAAALAWWQRLGDLRPWAALVGLLGLGVGLLFARSRRWSDTLVALYLDRKLGAQEAVATALELETSASAKRDRPAHLAVVSRAVDALRRPPPRGTWPRAWRLWHLLGPAAAGGIAWLSLVALPPAPAPPAPPPGSEMVKIDGLDELDAVVRLGQLDARDEEQRKRLDELARRAEELRRKLAQGMPKREAQDEIAKLRDAVAAERARLGTGEERQGLESAVAKLGKHAELREAQRALGDRDLTRFDEEMAKLANRLEAQDREAARQALEEAAEAARRKGAEGVAKALEEQSKLLEERAKRAERLRELADALGDGLSPEAKEALRNLEQSGEPQDLADLSDALGDALDQLSDEERKRLAEKLKQRASEIDPDSSDATAPDPQQLEELRKQLETEEGRKQLAEQLKRMAEEGGPESDESKRDRGLGDADKGLGEAQKKLGAPMPMESDGSGTCQGGGNRPGDGDKPGGNGKQNGNGAGSDTPGKPGSGSNQAGGGSDSPDGTPGPGRGGGPGEHGGKTNAVNTDPLRARAHSAVNPGSPMPGTVQGRSANPGGQVANDVGTGQLGTVAPAEVGAVDRGEIPKEYREQVGRYFQPD